MAAKYWGDEREPDALYSIYLRKVRYRPTATSIPKADNDASGKNYCPSFNKERLEQNHGNGTSCIITGFKPHNSESGISTLNPADGITLNNLSDHLQWETVKEKVLKAGTLQKLIQAFVNSDGTVESRQFNVFFATYRAFTKPHHVLRAILSEIYVVLSDDKQASTNTKQLIEERLKSWFNILNWWIDLYPDDFRDHPNYSCLTHLIEFTRIQQGNFYDLFIKCVRRRDEFSRSLLNPGLTVQHCVEKFVLTCPTDGSNFYSYATYNPTKIPSVSHVDSCYVAEQLTYIDAEIFKRLLPHQCQSCFWSKRNKMNRENSDSPLTGQSETQDFDVYTVKATIDQFNAVSRRVMSTVVHKVEMKCEHRAEIIGAWIDIAQELRFMKNFSSLKAVLSGLQSESVYRLKNSWAHVTNDKIRDFNELSRLFSEDDNYNGARALLEKEGTAKVVDPEILADSAKLDPQKKRQIKYRRVKSDMGEIQGTVPYLGTFLTDLTMIDTANPDYVEDGLINFEKRRKEFEILAQLKLFQAAARNYHLKGDPKFRIWFCSLPNLNEDQCYSLSCFIESSSAQRSAAKEKRSHTWSRILHFWDDERFVNRDKIKRPSDFLIHLRTKPAISSLFPKEPVTINDYRKKQHAFMQINSPFSCRKESSNFKTKLGTAYITEQSKFYDTDIHRNEFQSGDTTSNFYLNVQNCQFDVEPVWDANCDNATNVNNSCFSPTSDGSSFYKEDSDVSSPSATTFEKSYNNYANVMSNFNSPTDLSRPSPNDSGYYAEIPAHQKNNATNVQSDKDSFVIKIGLDDNLQTDPYSTTIYKSIKVENNDKTHKLVEKALKKHQINANPSDFMVVQILPDGDELVLPERGNAFYAVNKNVDLGFVLRKKTETKQNVSNLKSKKKRLKPGGGGLMFRWSSGFL